MNTLPFFPERASTIAGQIDDLYFAWVILSGVVALAVAVLVVWFAVRYRRGSAADRSLPQSAEHEKKMRRIEITWTLIPLLLFLAMFVWSAEVYYRAVTVPKDAQPIYVVAKQWMWHAEHTGGEREIDELHIPANRPIELVMTSQDVIHSLSIPGFRVKQDVLPGRYTTLWFTANRPGEYHLFCTQYCGASHSRMVGRVVVMEPAAFEGWLAEHANAPSLAARGAQRFRELGCEGCHGAQAAVHAPKLEGLFGTEVKLRDGRSVLADERFIRDAVLLPTQDVPAGYEPSMPSFRGQIGEEEMLEIIEYIKSLGNRTHEVVP
ncbi:MAG TPA: cytochrome c oxidase subunit II [Steroidobacteraceae bacterium]|nr:cytochrome c oxidase subunit II [Steroidobacteraceae bacterium]